MSKTLGRRCTNNIQMFCVYWTRDNNIIVNHVAKYKETASKSSRKYEKVRGEALADQEMGPGWSINSSIMSPEINLKCTQKQPHNKKILWGAHSAPQLLNSARCARHIFTSKLTLRYTLIKASRAYTKIIPGYAPELISKTVPINDFYDPYNHIHWWCTLLA